MKPSPVQLHQVTGEVFSLRPPAAAPFRYGPFAPESTAEVRFAQLVSSFEKRLSSARTPGGSIAVVVDGRLRFHAGVGLSRADGSEPVRSTTLFRTASLSKMIVAAAALSLRDSGELELDAPVTELVPSFRRGAGYDASRVTLAMALSHTAGLPEDLRGCTNNRESLVDFFRVRAEEPLWSTPGSLFNYSNAHYALVAATLEARSGRPFEEVVGARVFAPAGMSEATYAPAPDADIARGHDEAGHVVRTDLGDCAASRAAGGVYASVVDFAHFLEQLLAGGGTVLRPSSAAEMMAGHALMQASPREAYGYGLVALEALGLTLHMHTGGAFGVRTAVLLAKERNFAVVVFANGSFDPTELTYGALSAFTDVPEVLPLRVPTDPTTWRSWTGEYQDTRGQLGRIRVSFDQDRLWFALRGGQPQPIPAGLTGRFVRDEGGVMRFVTRVGVAEREGE